VCPIHIDGKGDTEEFRSRFRDVENRLQHTGYQVRIRKKEKKEYERKKKVKRQGAIAVLLHDGTFCNKRI
jgi:hypothetical protein